MIRSSLIALVLVVGPGCLFAPNIASEGYANCESSSECGPGWRCELGYCAPPAWWNEQYAARYQLRVENSSSQSLPAGVLAELVVGEGGDLSLEKAGFGPALIYADVEAGEQVRAVAMREPRGASYAFVFSLPDGLAAKSTFGSTWLYVGGSSELVPVYSPPAEVYSYYEPFTASELSTERFRVDGSVDLTGGQALLRPGAWLVTEDSFEGQQVSIDLQLAGADCTEFGLGLASGHLPQSLNPPYAMFLAGATSEVRHEILASTTSPLQTESDTFFSDGLNHRYSVQVLGDQVVFRVDHLVTAELTAAEPIEGPLHLHIYSRGCTVRIEGIQAAPAVVEAPVVKLSERVVWFP